MRLRLLPLLLFPMSLQAGLGEPVREIVEQYRRSPLQAHDQLRRLVLQGEEVEDLILTLQREIPEYSFDDWLNPHPLSGQAMELQEEAASAWQADRLEQALELYRRSASLLRAGQARTSLAFCHYYIASILMEQEEYRGALEHLEKGLRLAGGAPRPYLQSLLQEGMGYCLWQLDHLPAAVHSFGQALAGWERIPYGDGILNAWNNLAALYEELRLWERARRAYQRASDYVGPHTPAEIRFYLHANQARLLWRLGREKEAIREKEQARSLRWVDREEFRALELQLMAAGEGVRELQHFQPRSPSRSVSRKLLLANRLAERGQLEAALAEAEKALELARQRRLPYWVRKSLLELGRLLEESGNPQAALRLYAGEAGREGNSGRPEVVFPYSRQTSPFWEGWIRCLIRLGQPQQARRIIHHLSSRRRERARAFLRGLQGSPLPPSHPLRLEEVLQEAESSLPALSFSPAAAPPGSTPRLRSRLGLPESAALLELWPDEKEVYVWLESSAGTHFQVRSLEAPLSRLLSPLLDPLYEAQASLPPPPPPFLLRSLHRQLLGTLLKGWSGDTLLVLAHRELQALPLGLLVDEEGRFLMERLRFSYLPSPHPPSPTGLPQGPLAVFPRALLDRPSVVREKRTLLTLFPHLRVHGDLAALRKGGRWIHLATHLSLHPEAWLLANLNEGGENLLQLLQYLGEGPGGGLLSLGVCDAGNAYLMSSPYWMGAAELLLLQGAGSLLLSRWKMDEATSLLYRDFYHYAARGLPLEEALGRAKQDFRQRVFRRSGVAVRGDHPFFWAGITYVGLPGVRLVPPPAAPPLPWPLAAGSLLLGLVLGALLLRQTSAPGFHSSGGRRLRNRR